MFAYLATGFFCAFFLSVSPSMGVSQESQPTEEVERISRLLYSLANLGDDAHEFSPIRWRGGSVRAAIIFEPYHYNAVVENLLPRVQAVREQIFAETGFKFLFPRKLEDDKIVRVFVTFGSSTELISLAQDLERRIDLIGYSQLLLDQAELGLPVCGVAATWSDESTINAVAIAIENGPHIAKCVNENFFSAMGFYKEVSFPIESVVDSELSVNHLKKLDFILLRSLYLLDPSKSKFSLENTQEAIRTAITEL